MAFGLNRRLLNFLMSGWFFDEKKNKSKNNIDKNINGDNNSTKNNEIQGNVYDTKMDYVSKVTGFLEDGVREMRKDIKKL